MTRDTKSKYGRGTPAMRHAGSRDKLVITNESLPLLITGAGLRGVRLLNSANTLRRALEAGSEISEGVKVFSISPKGKRMALSVGTFEPNAKKKGFKTTLYPPKVRRTVSGVGVVEGNDLETSHLPLPIPERVKNLGIKPGEPLSSDKAAQVAQRIAVGSLDLFSTKEAARDYLRQKNFDGTALSAEELIEQGRSGRVLARMDELRYGPQG